MAYYKEPEKQQSQQHPVSVIICARDEGGNLTQNLPGILAQDYPTTHEVIVVNDNSYDETQNILADLKKIFKGLQVIDMSLEA